MNGQVGGTGTEEDGRYVLGDDALACLKDIKRWLKLYDEKTNRLDVARCLAEANLVKGDLLEILAAWPEDATEDRVSSKIALACCKSDTSPFPAPEIAESRLCSRNPCTLDMANRKERASHNAQSPSTYPISTTGSDFLQARNS
jgi:hypothetical protein